MDEYRKRLKFEVDRKINAIMADKSISKQDREYYAQQAWESYNDTIRKINKGE